MIHYLSKRFKKVLMFYYGYFHNLIFINKKLFLSPIKNINSFSNKEKYNALF